MPGPNLDPVKAILSGCPTPLKFVLFDLISSLTIGSKVSFLTSLILENLFTNSTIIFFASVSISFKSSLLN